MPTSRQGFFDYLSTLPSPAHNYGVPSRSLEEFRKLTQNWMWPLQKVQITSPFGRRNRHYHEGVDLKAVVGTPIYAVDAGKVLMAGQRISGYGKVVVIKHPSNLVTVYAHIKEAKIKRGQTVRQGAVIALSGQTGRVTGPHLHFEVRNGSNPLNPMALIPAQQNAKVAARRTEGFSKVQ